MSICVSLAAAYTTVPEEMSNSKTEMDENKEDFESFRGFHGGNDSSRSLLGCDAV